MPKHITYYLCTYVILCCFLCVKAQEGLDILLIFFFLFIEINRISSGLPDVVVVVISMLSVLAVLFISCSTYLIFGCIEKIKEKRQNPIDLSSMEMANRSQRDQTETMTSDEVEYGDEDY